MKYPHLRLTRWPFPAVPQQEFCDFIADRERLRGDIEGLLSTLSRQDASSIHLVWSWFGAGKTHTLFYLANQASTGPPSARRLHAVYSEFPKAAKSYVDLYKSFAKGLDIEELVEAYVEIATSPESPAFEKVIMQESPDLYTALRVLTMGEVPDRMTAMRWLHGDTLSASEFRRVGIAKRIGSSEEATSIMASIIRLFSMAAESSSRGLSRVIWLLDEYQRIDSLPPRLRQEISTGLHSTFNAAPIGLAIVLSFSGKPSENLPEWLTPELRDRIGTTKVLMLPPLVVEEGVQFVRDLLTRFRMPEYPPDLEPFFPFTEESCRIILQDIQQNKELKPRSIMQTFNAVLQEADALIEENTLDNISSQFAQKTLKEYTWTSELEADA